MAASKPKNAQKRTAKQAEVSAERVRDLIDASWRESKASKPVEMQPENMVIIPDTDILDAERRAKSCAIEALDTENKPDAPYGFKADGTPKIKPGKQSTGKARSRVSVFLEAADAARMGGS